MQNYRYTFLVLLIFIFGNVIAQQTGSLIDQRDDNIYTTVKIGEDVWMAENLRFMPKKESEDYPGKFYMYNWNKKLYKTHGALYSWHAARYACPYGWHLPTTLEWVKLFNHYGVIMRNDGKLLTKKEVGNIEFVEKENLYNKMFFHLQKGDSLNFDVSYGGYKDSYVARASDSFSTPGTFFGLGSVARYWTDDDNLQKKGMKKYNANGVIFQSWRQKFAITSFRKKSANSVRCVKD